MKRFVRFLTTLGWSALGGIGTALFIAAMMALGVCIVFGVLVGIGYATSPILPKEFSSGDGVIERLLPAGYFALMCGVLLFIAFRAVLGLFRWVGDAWRSSNV